MKNKIVFISIALTAVTLLAGNTHRFLSPSSDPCQQDMTHLNHINDLPMFHCIGHTEYVVSAGSKGLSRVKKWDHIHTWMTLEWHVEQGFTKKHALELIAHNKPLKSES